MSADKTIFEHSDEKPLQTVLEHVDVISKNDSTNLKYVLEDFGDRSFGPALLICGVILVTPIGAIPGTPIIMFLILGGFSLQILLDRRRPWLPRFLAQIDVEHGHVRRAKNVLRPYLRRVDGIVRPRWQWAAGPTCRKISALMIFLLGALLLPLGPIPFATTIPGFIIMLFGLGLTARDGMLISLAMSLTAIPILFFCRSLIG